MQAACWSHGLSALCPASWCSIPPVKHGFLVDLYRRLSGGRPRSRVSLLHWIHRTDGTAKYTFIIGHSMLAQPKLVCDVQLNMLRATDNTETRYKESSCTTVGTEERVAKHIRLFRLSQSQLVLVSCLYDYSCAISSVVQLINKALH